MYSDKTDSVLIAALVYNKSKKISTFTRTDGRYNIEAVEGDSLIFSAVGHERDTVVVEFYMLLTQYDHTLKEKSVMLEKVKVTSSYKKDSLERHLWYADIYKKQPGLIGNYPPQNGFGIVLNPLSFFSKAAKQKRELKKRLLKQDKEDYIDRAFPRLWVEKLTQLRGDSLDLFMARYRPSYEFCRKTDRSGMVLYINDRLKEFKKPKDS